MCTNFWSPCSSSARCHLSNMGTNQKLSYFQIHVHFSKMKPFTHIVRLMLSCVMKHWHYIEEISYFDTTVRFLFKLKMQIRGEDQYNHFCVSSMFSYRPSLFQLFVCGVFQHRKQRDFPRCQTVPLKPHFSLHCDGVVSGCNHCFARG